MKLFELTQNEIPDFTQPDRVSMMLIWAKTEEQARGFARLDEERYRGEQFWDAVYASCDDVTEPAIAGVLAVL